MANRREYPANSLTSNLSILRVQFGGNGTGNPPASTLVGRGFTVTRVSIGLYRVVIVEGYPIGQITVIPRVQTATATDLQVTLTSITAQTATRSEGGVTRTRPVVRIDLTVTTGAAPTDLTTAQSMDVLIVARNSLTPPLRGP